MSIRFAVPADSRSLLAIYGQYIETTVTFEYTLPSEEEFAERLREISAVYPYLVWEEGGRILGYAYAHRQSERAAYQWGAELSVYLDRAAAGRGLGRRLYEALMELLRRQGVRTVCAVVTSPNPASEGLHRAMGFRHLGTRRLAGYKGGAWRDVELFERPIGTYGPDPAPPAPIGSLPPETAAEVLRKYG